MKDQVGGENVGMGTDRRSGLRVLGIGMTGNIAGSGLDDDLDALTLEERLDRLGNQGNPVLAFSSFSGYTDLHGQGRLRLWELNE